jgi:hypothetical protein
LRKLSTIKVNTLLKIKTAREKAMHKGDTKAKNK